MSQPLNVSTILPDENLSWADYIDALLRQDARRRVVPTTDASERRLRVHRRNTVAEHEAVHLLLGAEGEVK